ncbi:MAG: SDR family oxidoreductase [Bacteroidetes bacterium]|nr:SDR family oxidoreductase [Bacteroidota bacterium]MBU1678935.1 SDR family oxidoreductase [Bacteroidota bacterium]
MPEKEKIVWITGASSGIGKSLVYSFASRGFNVAASARRIELLERMKNDSGFAGSIHLFPMDVSNLESIIKTSKEISKSFVISGLINNAGLTSFKNATENSYKEIDDIIDTNLKGAIYTIQSTINGMIKRKEGKIFNILSVAAKKIFINSSVYSASKAGLLAYSNVLREELRFNGISITNVLPGATKTPIWQGEALSKFSSRMMSPDDLAEVIFSLYKVKGSAIPEEITFRPIKGDL